MGYAVGHILLLFLFIIPEDQFLLPLPLGNTKVLPYIWIESLGNRSREVLSQVIAFGHGSSQYLEIQVCHAHLNLHKECICWSQVLAQPGTLSLCIYMSQSTNAGLPLYCQECKDTLGMNITEMDPRNTCFLFQQKWGGREGQKHSYLLLCLHNLQSWEKNKICTSLPVRKVRLQPP